MRKQWQLLAALALSTALATSGHAGSGQGKIGGNSGKSEKGKRDKRHKPSKNAATSSTVGQIIVSDERILDLTGDYTLTGTPEGSVGVATLILSLIQDGDGDLVGNSVLTLPDGSTTEVAVTGDLDLESRRRSSELTFELAGTIGESDDDDDDWFNEDHHSGDSRSRDDDDDDRDETRDRDDDGDRDDEDSDDDDSDHDGDDDDSDDDDSDDDDSDHDDDNDDITTSVRVSGEWDGSAFQTLVSIKSGDDTYRFESSLVPVNPLRGFTVEPATDVQNRGKVIFGQRLVLLPWGVEEVRSLQINSRGFKLMLHGEDFEGDFSGSVDTSGTASLTRAKVSVGYGHMELDPEDVIITPAP